MQILQWLDSPAVEDGPLQAQLKLFATRYSARRRISDGEQVGRGWVVLMCWGQAFRKTGCECVGKPEPWYRSHGLLHCS